MGDMPVDGHTAMVMLEERDMAHRRASLGKTPLLSAVPGAVIASGFNTMFLIGVVASMVVWKTMWAPQWRALGTDGMEVMPLASVPIALLVAAFIDGGLGATSALGRGIHAGSSTQVSPLTPRLCAIMAVVFICVYATHLPLLGSAALRDITRLDAAGHGTGKVIESASTRVSASAGQPSSSSANETQSHNVTVWDIPALR